MLKILVADDHDVVRAGIRALIEARAEWHVVAEAGDGPTAIDQAFATKPDVAIIDYSLPIINGGDVTRQIRSKLPGTEVLIFTMHDSDAVVRDILGAGAKGYVSKSDAQRYLEMAVESLAMHRPFFTGKISETLLDAFRSGGASVLTSREKTLVRLIAEGHTSKQISELLHISDKTVQAHRASAMRKLNVPNTAALVRYAVRNKLVEP